MKRYENNYVNKFVEIQSNVKEKWYEILNVMIRKISRKKYYSVGVIIVGS